MKQVHIILALMIAFTFNAYSQETTKPLTNAEVVRKVNLMDIEGELFMDVVANIKSSSPDYLFTDNYKVKITIVDKKGKKIWKKTLKNSFLCVFSDGRIQIGKGNNFWQIVFDKLAEDNWYGIVREKEGIY